MTWLNKGVKMVMLAAVLMAPAQAMASREARPLPTDHRVRTVMYQPDVVYKMTGHYRFQSSIEFEPDEEIKTISMGDSTSWLINPSGFRLFLKPVEQDATTNMTLITNKRTYLFELHAKETDDINDESLTFIMRFLYPEASDTQSISRYLDSVPLPDLERNPGKYNRNYTISGTNEIAPVRIFDDGEFTYFQFRDKNAEVPAFYWVDESGAESLINYRTRGDYIVIERVASRFTLRHGRDVVCVFNETRLARGGDVAPPPPSAPQGASAPSFPRF
jgi:type IV secretion system protein VirB9